MKIKHVFAMALLGIATLLNAAPQIQNATAKQRFPWNGKVDINYTLTGDVTVGLSPDAEIVLSVTASNRVDGATFTAEASALSGDTGTAEGAHHVIWDLNAQGLEIKSDEVVFTVGYAPVMRYCIIDLSGGANASSYPVMYVASVPSGGWSDEYKTTKLVLRLIEPGTFMMGNEYQVTLTKPFYCGVFEVTQKQYELVTGDKPSYFNNESCYATRPVEKVSYNMIRGSTAGAGWPGSSAVDGNSFLGKLQARTGQNFDLPTEAQWEYACRAGTTTDYNSGKNNTGSTCANMNEVGRYLYNGGQNYSQSGDVSGGTAKVGSYQPNAWGLYDMHGNVWEWCLDWYGNLSSGVTDPVGSSSGSARVLRGGSWCSNADDCTSSYYRGSGNPSSGIFYNFIGFRLVRTLSNPEGERSPEAVAGAERADVLCAAEAAPVAIDSRVDMKPVLESVVLPWNAEWIGGDSGATVVITDNGTEVKRTTGSGEFTHTLTGDGRHELTYTTFINGVAQDEVYTATVFKNWKYNISNLTAKQRFPWNGKVDINYTLTGDLTAGLSQYAEIALLVTASNRVDGATYTAEASALSGDTGTAEGAHHVIWDLNEQGLAIKSDEVVFTVAYEGKPMPYCVIDLSGGANATSYPVSYLASVPSGGWSDEYKTTKLVLRLVEPGTFMMCGSYQVTLTKPFYCGVFEVTQKQYELVTGSNPSSYTGDMRPVERVSWDTIRGDSSTYNWPGSANVDSNSFVGRLQARTGLNFDLPTEAQWEYACRAGTTSKYNNGGDTENDLRELGRYWDNRSDGKGWYSDHTTVGSYQPNAWGLYDMHGNVLEWCLDRYGDLSSGATDPGGSSSGSDRVGRGGSWFNDADDCASSYRNYFYPSFESSSYGFRLVRTLSSTESERSPEAAAGAERAGALCAAAAAPVAIDSRMDVEPLLDSVAVAWDAAWIGGDSGATVVITDNGTEVKRTTGSGEFTHTLTGDGRHELTYTTFINGVAQDEVYTATVFKNWKYNISNLTAKQRFPWNGKVDITYTLTGDVTAGLSPDAEIVLLVTASNRVDGATYTAEASALSGDTGTAEGAHHVIWDLNEQGLEIKSDEVVFMVAYEGKPMPYCVINLSGGANAASYPVTYLADVPSGGWSDEYKTTKLVLRLIEPGTFMMCGLYQVTLTKPFYCGVFEVTQKQYELVTGDKPSYFNNESCYATRPVEQVSYNMIRGSTAGAGWPGSSAVDGNSFLGKLQARAGLNFDLPTEAQWEYACRAGTTTDYNSGKNNTGSTCANMNEVGRYWYNGGQNYSQSGDVSSGTAKVGSYQPNAWGLYDMHGNVWEWCLDWYGSLSSGATDPVGSSSGSIRVLRGGCWDSHADGCTSSYRSSIGPSGGGNVLGFRLVRTLSSTESERSPEAVAGAERADALCAAEAAPVAIDSRVDMEPVLESVVLPWNAEWIGGDANATVVIADNGTEVKRATGAGEFELVGDGRHELTYTTYVGGVAQDEVYTATVYKGWKYDVVDGGAVIREMAQKAGIVTIPAELDGFPVVSLGTLDLRDVSVDGCYESGGFRICNGWVLGYDDDEVEYLEVPEGIVGIAPYALSELWYLEEVVLPESLRHIGYRAFMGDTFLDNVVIPDCVENIDDEAFRNCTYIQTLALGGGLRCIGARAFERNTQLSTLKIPDAVEEIGDFAFSNCWRMQSVKLPLNLSEYGRGVFADCRSLAGVTVPAGNWTMQQLFPARYSAITSATVIGGEERICENAFSGCSSLQSVYIPVGITNICAGAFWECSSLKTVELPATLEAVDSDAFRSCSALEAIVLPDSVVEIGMRTFQDCRSLANITLSRSLAAIPDYAFHNCSRLSSMVVPESVTNLGAYIGNYFSALYFLGNAPACNSNVYAMRSTIITTYVVNKSLGWDGIPMSRDLPEKWNGYDITFWTPNRFFATFDANGGTFELTDETSGVTQYACQQITDTSYALPPFEPVWEGHVFDGWWTERSDGAQITAMTRVNETRPVTYYAHWIGDPKEVAVRFNANGGTVEPGEGNYYASRPYGQLPVPTREYHRFAGWWTLPQGGSRVVVSTAVPAADQVLYAHWTPETYVIRYHANGGSGSMADQAYTYGSTVTLTPNAFWRADGLAFLGWAVAADGAVVYTDGKTLSQIAAIQDGVINLYAVWASLEYAVRFDSNGGYGVMANQTIAIDEEAALAVNVFERMGFEFLGWSGTPSGDVAYANGQSVRNLTTRPGATVVLYAVWRLVSPMPQVGNDADVGVVMANAPAALKDNVTSLAEYNAYRAWAAGKAKEAAAVSSANGWLSFALDADKLIEKELTQDDVEVAAFEPTGTAGAYALEVSLKDIEVGDAADGGRLATVFGLEGSTTLELDSFSSENVTLEASEPVGGKVRLTAKPMPKTPANAFFMRVKLKK